MYVTMSEHLPHVRRKVELTSITRHHVALERFLPVKLESIHSRENHNFVVHALTGQPLEVRGKGHSWHTVHARISNVLHVHGDVPRVIRKIMVNNSASSII